MRDPFHEKIRTALAEKKLNREQFEPCMCDLLRADFPGLAPIPGGDDAGMDGAIADGQGEAYPLVCTTGDDVIGNLSDSLDSYLRRGGQRRKVVLATSQALTPSRRRNLEARAREKGFTLEQIFDQAAVTDRLYRNQRWCRDLLGLPGRPSPLSKVPLSRRPFLEIDLVGRDADIAWLKETSGDRVVCGDPGSGKTYLARHLVRDGWGLFLVSRDEGEIAGSLREQQPEIVVVDDAHRDPSLLEVLRRLREELGGQFSIVALTWKGDRDRVIAALGGASSCQVRHLELLTRDEIRQVIEQVGILGPDQLLRELIDQAANKPGLAVTLAQLCQRGDWQEVLSGKALGGTLLTAFQELVGREPTTFLAAFALGGDRGMPLEPVGRQLGRDLAATRELAIGLAAGGVLSEERGKTLAVWPSALRSFLLCEVFFSGSAVSLPYRGLIDSAPSRESAVLAVLSAAHRGGRVSEHELRDLVSECGSGEAWSTYAALGESQGRWALEHYPGDAKDLAREALISAPGATIPMLLNRAVTATGPLHSQPEHPLRILRDWLIAITADPSETIRRRELAVRMVQEYLRSGGERIIGVRAILLALSPELEGQAPHPSNVYGITISWGLVPEDLLPRFCTLWQQVRDDLGTPDTKTWRYYRDMVWAWFQPTYAEQNPVPEGVGRTMRTFAETVIHDLASKTCSACSPGLVSELLLHAARFGFQLPLEPDPLFELLYPEADWDLGDDPAQSYPQEYSLRNLAEQWLATSSPQWCAQALARYEDEVSSLDLARARRTPEFCRYLAEATRSPATWLSVLIEEELPGDLVHPFLERIVASKPEGWEQTLATCLETEIMENTATSLVLQLPEPPPPLLERALAIAGEDRNLVKYLCRTGQVPVATMICLLRHPNWQTAAAAAVGEYLADDRGCIREPVLDYWRGAIVRYREDNDSSIDLDRWLDHWVGKILESEPELSFQWLCKHLEHEIPLILGGDRSATEKALASLEEKHRISLLERASNSALAHRLLPGIIGGSPEVYRHLLSQPLPESIHLAPLTARVPDQQWVTLALVALDHGYQPQRIALAVPQAVWDEAEHWDNLDKRFAAFEQHEDSRVCELARIGRDFAQQSARQARDSQRREAISGRS